MNALIRKILSVENQPGIPYIQIKRKYSFPA
jgi:hypothetical protein